MSENWTKSFSIASRSRCSAEQRLAVILLNFSQRFLTRGLSANRFRLPMSRLDLSSYLLVPETMSRTFKRLQDQGVLYITGREVDLIDARGLEELACCSSLPVLKQ